MNKTCIVVAGPTAVGKTHFAIQLAQHFNTQIISADSRQCYKELNIGVAKPTSEELNLAPHYFINTHSISEEVNAAIFENYALQKINEIFKHHDIAVVVGGTGLYIKAFCEGIDVLPKIDETIREKIILNYQQNGLPWLQNEVKKQDPLYFLKGEIKNPQRLMRALEVILSTRQSILHFQTHQKKQRPFNIVKWGLELPKPELIKNINCRVEAMVDAGLVQEVKNLQSYKNLNALQTVGYKELFEYFENKITLDAAVEKIKINTRQYAKRQMTWFKKDSTIHWVSPHFSTSILQNFINPKPLNP